VRDTRSPEPENGMEEFGQDVCFARGGLLFRLRAAAIIIKDGRVLMVRNGRASYYYSVGGAVRLGETVQDAVRREVMEECGLDLGILRLAAIHQNFFRDSELGGHSWHELTFYYLMDYKGGQVPSARSLSMFGSPETLHWIPLDTYSQHKAYPAFFADLENILQSPVPVQIVTREQAPAKDTRDQG